LPKGNGDSQRRQDEGRDEMGSGPNRLVLFVVLAAALLVATYVTMRPAPAPPEGVPAAGPPDAAAGKTLPLDLSVREGVRARMVATDADAVRIVVQKLDDADPFAIQASRPIGEVRAGEKRIVSFEAKADRPREILLTATIVKEPWTNIGLYETIQIGEEWKWYAAAFQVGEAAPEARIYFNFGQDDASIELRGVSIQKGDKSP
jgi:hypothetical protein